MFGVDSLEIYPFLILPHKLYVLKELPTSRSMLPAKLMVVWNAMYHRLKCEGFPGLCPGICVFTVRRPVTIILILPIVPTIVLKIANANPKQLPEEL